MGHAEAAAPDAAPRLQRAIGRGDLTLAIVNAVIGSAIFAMPSEIAALTGTASPLTFVVAAFFVLTIVACFAEVASRFDRAGGPYLYASAAFGPAVGFQAGWLTFWVRTTAVAANLNVMMSYLATLAPAVGSGLRRFAVMAALLGVITALNVRGVKHATRAIDALTILKLLPPLLLVVLAVPRYDAAVVATQEVASPQWAAALLLLVYAYGGFESPLMAAGEARDPRRDTAFALLAGLAIITAAYTAVQVGLLGLVPHLGATKAPIAEAFARLFGGGGAALASAAAVLSIGAWSVGTVLQTPRLLFGMADRGELPPVFARVHPVFRTPHVAIVVYAVAALALAVAGSFRFNATLSALTRLLTYGLTCAALPVLRRRSEEPAGFLLPGGHAVWPVALLFCAVLLAGRALDGAWVLLVMMAVGELLRRWRPGAPRG